VRLRRGGPGAGAAAEVPGQGTGGRGVGRVAACGSPAHAGDNDRPPLPSPGGRRRGACSGRATPEPPKRQPTWGASANPTASRRDVVGSPSPGVRHDPWTAFRPRRGERPPAGRAAPGSARRWRPRRRLTPGAPPLPPAAFRALGRDPCRGIPKPCSPERLPTPAATLFIFPTRPDTPRVPPAALAPSYRM